jgi:hypothetical protein
MISDAIEAVLPAKPASSSSSSSNTATAPISITGEEFFDYSTSAAATAIPSQGRVRTPQLQSLMSETIAARAITYPRRRNQGRLTTWVNDVPPTYRSLLANPVYEAVIGDIDEAKVGGGEGKKQMAVANVEALGILESRDERETISATKSSQCLVS